MDGGPVTKLNAPLTAGGQVSHAAVTPDGGRVVYLTDSDFDDSFDGDVIELYSVAATGGPVTKLNAPLVAGGRVGTFRISPDGSLVVYQADPDADGVFDLYSVPVAGGHGTKLTALPMTSRSNPPTFQITPNSGRVVYPIGPEPDTGLSEVYELYSVPVGGGESIKLNGPLVGGGGVNPAFLIAPDGRRVVYLADQDTDQVFELYSVPVTGGIATKLNAPLVTGGQVYPNRFQVTADGSRVVYVADQDRHDAPDLYSVAIEGGPVTRLSSAGDATPVRRDFQLTPDGSRVVYVAVRSPGSLPELYSVPTTGGPATKLDLPGFSAGVADLNPFRLQITRDSTRVVYVANPGTLPDEFFHNLFSVPVAGGPVMRLNDPLVAGGHTDPWGVEIAPDGRRVVYLVSPVWRRPRQTDLYAARLPVFADVPPTHPFSPSIETLEWRDSLRAAAPSLGGIVPTCP